MEGEENARGLCCVTRRLQSDGTSHVSGKVRKDKCLTVVNVSQC